MRLTTRTSSAAALLTLGLLAAACGSSSSTGSNTTTGAGATTTAAPSSPYGGTPTTGSPTTVGSSATSTPASGQAAVSVASSSLGSILVDSKGMTLYVYDGDTTAGKSSCNGGCASAWPPLAVTGTPTYGTGLKATMFSTITRDDGSKQLAVNGKPLYLWQGDSKAGDVTGQGVNGFHVVGADGNKM